MHCLGHVSMYALYAQNNTQTRPGVVWDRRSAVTVLKMRMLRLRKVLWLCKRYRRSWKQRWSPVPSARYSVAIPSQAYQSYSVLAFYPDVSSRSATSWEPNGQGTRNCVPRHLCSLGSVPCCLAPRCTEPKGRGREHSVLDTCWEPGSLILPATHDRLQRCELFSLYEWRAEVQRLSKRVPETWMTSTQPFPAPTHRWLLAWATEGPGCFFVELLITLGHLCLGREERSSALYSSLFFI